MASLVSVLSWLPLVFVVLMLIAVGTFSGAHRSAYTHYDRHDRRQYSR